MERIDCAYEMLSDPALLSLLHGSIAHVPYSPNVECVLQRKQVSWIEWPKVPSSHNGGLRHWEHGLQSQNTMRPKETLCRKNTHVFASHDGKRLSTYTNRRGSFVSMNMKYLNQRDRLV